MADVEYDGIPIINPLELPKGRHDRKSLFRMWADAYGTTRGYVWADHSEYAFEEWVEWLDDNAPRALVLLSQKDYEAAAEDLGLQWQEDWPDWGDREFERVATSAEADLTPIGHTTLKNGTHIPSHEWGFDEADEETFRGVWEASAAAYEEEYDDFPDPPPHLRNKKRGVKVTGLDAVPAWIRPRRR